MPLQEVRSGDLITKDSWNLMVQLVNALEEKVNRPDTSPGVVSIRDLRPSNQRRPGEELQIIGVNFARSIGAARVAINEQQVDIKPNSTDTQLNIDIPRGLTPGTATLRVSNSATSDTRTIVILPEDVPLTNNIEIQWLDVNPTLIRSGSPTQLYTFRYQVISRTNRAATFTFNPVVSVAAWQSNVRVLNNLGSELPERQIPLTPNVAVVFQVQMRMTTQLTTGTPFNLRIDVTAEDRFWSLGDHTFREGEDTRPADPAIQPGTPIVEPASAFNDPTNTITLGINSVATLTMEIGFTGVGEYVLVIDPTSPISGWTVTPALETPIEVPITQAQLGDAGGRVPIETQFHITAPATLRPQVQVNIGYGRRADPSRRGVQSFNLLTS